MLKKAQPFPSDLAEGYKAFKEGRFQEERRRYDMLAELGQKPKSMVIACSDSRSAPETIFNAPPGSLFVVRNVANLVPPCELDLGFHGTSAALEFAVQALKVENIVVLGHALCGGILASLTQDEELVETKPLSSGDFIGKWITLLEPAKKKMKCCENADFSTRRRALEQAGVRNSIENLLTFPCVKTLVERGKLALHGAWFDISNGELFVLDHETGDFIRSS